MKISTSERYMLSFHLPRNIWIMFLQFFFSFVLQLPVYYYIWFVIELTAISTFATTLFLPLFSALVLASIQVLLNRFFWYNEKTLKKRDFLKSAIKSSLMVSISFYLIFFFLLTWGLSSVYYDYYGPFVTSEIVKLTFDFIVSNFLVCFIGGSLYFFQSYIPKRVKY